MDFYCYLFKAYFVRVVPYPGDVGHSVPCNMLSLASEA